MITIGRQHTHNTLRRQRTNAFTVTGTSNLSARACGWLLRRVLERLDLSTVYHATYPCCASGGALLHCHITLHPCGAVTAGCAVDVYVLICYYAHTWLAFMMSVVTHMNFCRHIHPLFSVRVSLSCLLETICWFTEA